MGAWGTGSFENDDAMDWAGDLVESRDFDLVRRALEIVIDAGDSYLEAPDASAALAAAEVVAAMKGIAAPDLPQGLAEIVARGEWTLTPDLTALAHTAVERVKDKSELQELWAEAGDLAAWQERVDDLATRVASS